MGQPDAGPQSGPSRAVDTPLRQRVCVLGLLLVMMPSSRSSSARLARRCVGHNSHPGHTILRGAGTSAWCILRKRPRRAARPRRSRCVGARQVARAVGGGARRCCSRWKCKTCPLPCMYTAPRPAARSTTTRTRVGTVWSAARDQDLRHQELG